MHTYIQLHNTFYKVIHIHTHIHTHAYKQLTLEQGEFKLCESACTWIFFNTKYSTT